MFGSLVAQIIGTIAVAMFGASMMLISSSVQRMTYYGREALACSGAVFLTVSVVRVFSISGTITADESRGLTGLAYCAYLAILLQIVILRQRSK